MLSRKKCFGLRVTCLNSVHHILLVSKTFFVRTKETQYLLQYTLIQHCVINDTAYF